MKSAKSGRHVSNLKFNFFLNNFNRKRNEKGTEPLNKTSWTADGL